MAWNFVDLRDGMREYRSDWQGLNRRLNGGHPLLGADFVEPLVRHYAGPKDRLALHLGPKGVDAMVALNVGALKWRSFRPSQAQLSPTLLSHRNLASSLLASLPLSVAMLDLMCLDLLYAPDLEEGSPALTERSVHATTIQVAVQGPFENFWGERTKKLQVDLQNKLNRLQKDGLACEMHIHESPVAVGLAVRRYAELEMQGWKASQGTAVQLGTTQGNFYCDVMQGFAAKGAATVFELFIGGVLAASQFVIRGGGMSVHLKTTHNETQSRYAPGYLLGHHILRHEFEVQRVQKVEYYTNADKAKLRWGSAQRALHHDRLYRSRLARTLVNGMNHVKHWRQGPEESPAAQARPEHPDLRPATAPQ